MEVAPTTWEAQWVQVAQEVITAKAVVEWDLVWRVQEATWLGLWEDRWVDLWHPGPSHLPLEGRVETQCNLYLRPGCHKDLVCHKKQLITTPSYKNIFHKNSRNTLIIFFFLICYQAPVEMVQEVALKIIS